MIWYDTIRYDCRTSQIQMNIIKGWVYYIMKASLLYPTVLSHPKSTRPNPTTTTTSNYIHIINAENRTPVILFIPIINIKFPTKYKKQKYNTCTYLPTSTMKTSWLNLTATANNKNQYEWYNHTKPPITPTIKSQNKYNNAYDNNEVAASIAPAWSFVVYRDSSVSIINNKINDNKTLTKKQSPKKKETEERNIQEDQGTVAYSYPDSNDSVMFWVWLWVVLFGTALFHSNYCRSASRLH